MNRNKKGQFIKGHESGMTGKEQTDETKDKISKANKGHKFYGGKRSWFKKGERASMNTEFKNGNKPWNYGMSLVPDHSFRMGKTYNEWRKKVFERDDYTCQLCGERGGKLNADHIKPYSVYKDKRVDLNNGRTLCEGCHRKTDTYGMGVYSLLKITENK